MTAEIAIRSDCFPPDPEEFDEVNPGRFGRKLANHVRDLLLANGQSVSEIGAEDWGYEMSVSGFKSVVSIGCGNVDDTTNKFVVFLVPGQPFVWGWMGKAKKGPTQSAIKDLHTLIRNDFQSNPKIAILD